uniref:Uncharacterized protein n=1 Tax=Panagrolaimus davidi TaxID=227884 RepID=A0A914QVE1_9BILA
MAFNRSSNISVERQSLSPDSGSNAAVWIDSAALSSDSSRNVAFGTDGVSHGFSSSSYSSRNAAVGIDGDSLPAKSFEGPRAPSFEGLRAPSVANIVGSPRTENNICDENFEGLRAPSVANNIGRCRTDNVISGENVECLRAPRTENNVESFRAGNIIFGDGIEVETVRDEITVEQQIPHNSSRAQPEFMEVVVDKVIDVDEKAKSEIERLKFIVNETYDNFCKRVKQKKSTKLKARWNKDKQNAKEQIVKIEKEIEERRQRRDRANNEVMEVDAENGEPVLMGAMIDINRLNADEMVLNNESELVAQVEESFPDYCKRMKKKQSAKLKQKWLKDKTSAEEQIAKNEKEREKRRLAKEAQSENERKRKRDEAREIRNINNDNGGREAKKRRLENKRDNENRRRDNESEVEREARLDSQREIQNRLRENETEEEREARLNSQREIQNRLRENETEEQREERLSSKRDRENRNRELEDEEEREERLNAMRENYHEQQQNPRQEFAAANSENVEEFRTGPQDRECSECKALHFEGEAKMKNGAYDSCCNGGKVKVDIGPYPEELKRLMKREEGTNWRELDKNMLKYNTSMSFAYTKGEMRQLPGIFHYRIQGQMMHVLPRYTDPLPGHNPAFGQLWIVETNEAVEYRCQAPFALTCSREINV